MRKAFSMLMAIVVIVIVATLSALVLSLGGRVVKSTTIQYRQEQAALLAKSYTELAVMAILNYDRNASNDCVENVNGVVNNLVPGGSAASGVSSTNGGGYDVQTRIYYIGENLPCSTSRVLNTASLVTNYADGNASAGGSVAAVLIDVFVRYKDPDAPNPATAPWITYHHRTIQKI
jgi:type II secretory pathway pseudopilin PulG